jgi:hypothetical protein
MGLVTLVTLVTSLIIKNNEVTEVTEVTQGTLDRHRDNVVPFPGDGDPFGDFHDERWKLGTGP